MFKWLPFVTNQLRHKRNEIEERGSLMRVSFGSRNCQGYAQRTWQGQWFFGMFRKGI